MGDITNDGDGSGHPKAGRKQSGMQVTIRTEMTMPAGGNWPEMAAFL